MPKSPVSKELTDFSFPFRKTKSVRKKSCQSTYVDSVGSTAAGLEALPDTSRAAGSRASRDAIGLPAREHQRSFDSMEAFAGSRENIMFTGSSSASGSGQTDSESAASDPRTIPLPPPPSPLTSATSQLSRIPSIDSAVSPDTELPPPPPDLTEPPNHHQVSMQYQRKFNTLDGEF